MSPDMRTSDTRARQNVLSFIKHHQWFQELCVILTIVKIVQLHLNRFIYTREAFKWHLIDRKKGWKEIRVMEIVQCEHMDQQAAKAPPCQSSG